MTRILYILFCLLAFSQAIAQNINATLLETNFYGSSYPDNLILVGNKIYFSAIDYRGRELWVHDRSTNTTEIVKNICFGSGSGLDYFYSSFAAIDNILYFSALPSVDYELWRSDGTPDGTWLVKDVNPTGDSYMSEITALNGKLIFSANDGVNGQELWISDGTTVGTHLLKDLKSGSQSSSPIGFFEFNNNLYFSASTPGGGMWKTDGTFEGTVLISTCHPIFSDKLKALVFNNDFYFYANSTLGGELWKSDGTAEGTEMVKDIYPGYGSSADHLIGAVTSNYLLFSAEAPGTTGKEIWRTDGTTAGTILVKDINVLNSSLDYYQQTFVTLHDKVYFSARDETGSYQLWTSDGTFDGTQKVTENNTGPNPFNYICKLAATNNYLIFSASEINNNYLTPFISDGTASGTFRLVDLNLGYSGISQSQYYYTINDEVYFQGGFTDIPIDNVELWHTDGTSAGTLLVKDIYHASSGVGGLTGELGWHTRVNGKSIYFAGVPYVSDGTYAGTYKLKDLHIYSNSSENFPPCLTVAGNNAFFRAGTTATGYELCVTDGTIEGTHLVKNIGSNAQNGITEYPFFMSYNNILYFKADDQINGSELWRSDGTENGTYLLKDINVGPGSSLTQNSLNQFLGIQHYAVFNGLLYFRANDGVVSSIWKTDGTPEGTQIAFTPPSSGSNDRQHDILNSGNGKIYFTTNINNGSYANNSIWASDGTLAGTQLLGSYFLNGDLRQFERNEMFNGDFYYTVYLIDGPAVIKTNGTPEGTAILKSNFTTTRHFNYMRVCGDYLYFSLSANNLGFDDELWRTDGTTDGTIKLGGNDGDSSLKEYSCVGDQLIYLQNNGNNVMITDGSLENTRPLDVHVVNGDQFGDYNPIFQAGDYVNNKLLVSGLTDTSGREIYALDILPLLSINTPNNGSGLRQTIIAYPNPTHGKITLESANKSTIQEITVFDILGRQIFKQAFSDASAILELEGATRGLYILRIKTDLGTETKKIILK